MKFNIYFKTALLVAAAGAMTSCNDFLDQEPKSQVTPEKYFNDEASLQAYANGRYGLLPGHDGWGYGVYAGDNNTDTQAGHSWSSYYVRGKWKTGMDNGNWSFTDINTINYFFDVVMPKYEAGTINGSKQNIDRYIGEMHFFRAYAYFTRLKQWGDFPIITECLPDEMEPLVEASKRSPRNEVARFILAELDKAYEMMKNSSAAKTRVNADVVMLFKSRVALWEGTWEKNFAGTAFVPGTAEWPGKAYHPDFSFPAGSAEAEWQWFLQQAVDAAKLVGDKYMGSLTKNTGLVPHDVDPNWDAADYTYENLDVNNAPRINEAASTAAAEAMNPWLAMFGAEDVSGYDEVLMWRQYNKSLITHNVPVMATRGNMGCGLTKGMVDCYTMANGLPIYASGSGYKGEGSLHKIRMDRDPRLFVFLKEPGQKNIIDLNSLGDHDVIIEPVPNILESDDAKGYTTGFAMRKGNNYNQIHGVNGGGYTGLPVFRSVEALLNYIEAYYELHGSLDGTADNYWKAIRGRNAGMETNYMITVNATQMAEEAKGDWAAYTAGALIDPLRYNIRRERRIELLAEGFRWDDLARWRSLEQLATVRPHIEGINIWGTPMKNWYKADELKNAVNAASISNYIRPHEAKSDSEVLGGLDWEMAHYLQPMPIKQLMLTSPDYSTASQSVTYQNPYWPLEPNVPATK